MSFLGFEGLLLGMQVLVLRRQGQVISALVNFDLRHPLREVA
jgi:hypothetical protein